MPKCHGTPQYAIIVKTLASGKVAKRPDDPVGWLVRTPETGGVRRANVAGAVTLAEEKSPQARAFAGHSIKEAD
jgi:hypothetical protein